MLADLFSGQCAVVHSDDSNDLLGFISTIQKPTSLNTLFVWQICIDQQVQKRGLAKSLINFVLKQQKEKVDYIETTISDDNQASQNLFKSVAKDYNAAIKKTVYVSADEFRVGHETEYLYTIGTLKI